MAIISAVKNLLIRAGADFSSMRKEMQKAHKDMSDFKQNMSRTMKGVTAALTTIAGALSIGAAVKDALNVEAAMGQLNRTMGESAQAFNVWAQSSASAFGFSRSEAIRFGAVYSNLLSGFSKDTTETYTNTMALLKATSVVASSTGRSIEDVSERIRSGLLGNTESIEDLGINVNIAMIESTKAFQTFANGKHWNQLNFQTQQQIRLFAILEQASTKYGDTLANNTASKQLMLVAQLNNIKLAFGQAFLPIYNAVLPALTRFATAIANVVNFIAQFISALFGYKQAQQSANAVGDQAKAVAGLGKAYDKAGKKAKGALAGFDQINLVGNKTGKEDTPQVGAAPGIDMSAQMGAMSDITNSMADVSKRAQEMAQKVKDAFSGMSSFIKKHKDIIVASLAGIAAGFATFLIVTKWSSIISGITTALSALRVALLGTWAAITAPVALIAVAVAALVAAFVYFYRTNESFRGVVDGILRQIGEAAQWLWNNVLEPFGAWLADVMPKAWDAVSKAAAWFWNNVLVPFGDFLKWLWTQVLVPIGSVLVDVLGIAFKTVAQIARDFWEKVIVPLGKALSEMFRPAVEAISAVLSFLWKNVFVPFGNFANTVLKPIIQALIDVFVFLWKNALQPLANFVSNVLVTVFSNAFNSIGGVINGVKNIFIGLMNFITGVFTGDWKKAWEGVKTVFKGVMDGLWAVVKFPLNLIIDGINALIKGLNKVKVDVPGWVQDITGYTSFGFNIPTIPKLANGGLAFGPTLSMVGDNLGAFADPEVIAPLSKLEGMIGGSDNADVVTELRSILKVLKDNRVVQAVISSQEITKTAISGINDITRRSGRNPLTI